MNRDWPPAMYVAGRHFFNYESVLSNILGILKILTPYYIPNSV